MSEQKPDNVVPLFAIREKPEKQRHCRHGGTMEIDEETELVQCGLCGAYLSAFSALRVLTREWERHTKATKWARYSYDQLAKKVGELKKEERNTKARLRKARRSLESLS